MRFNRDLSVDDSFDMGEGFPSAAVYDLELSRDGGLFVGGSISSFNGLPVTGLIKLNSEFLFAIQKTWVDELGVVHFQFNSLPGDVYALESTVDFVTWEERERLEADFYISEISADVHLSAQFYRVVRVEN